MTLMVSLSVDCIAFIESKVASRQYASVSGVICAALWRMQQAEQHQDAELERLRRTIDEGLASGSARPFNMQRIVARARGQIAREIASEPHDLSARPERNS